MWFRFAGAAARFGRNMIRSRRMFAVAAAFAVPAFLSPSLPAQRTPISDREALQPPGSARLTALAAEGARAGGAGWAEIGEAARRAAFTAYAQDKLNAAEGWENLHRWAALFSQTEARFVLGWIQAMNQAEAGHANLAKNYALANQPLGARLSPELQAWLVSHAAFSSEFFSLLSPVDYLPQVFSLLDEIHRSASLRARGEKSLAEFEEARLARKYQEERSDLSLQQALGMLQRSFASQSPAEQNRTYTLIVDRYGRGAGIGFFDRIVLVFAEHLLQAGDRPGALKAVEYARAALKVEPGRQLDQELTNLANRLKKAE